MDYYLFDTVKSIVSRLRADTKDKNIFIFKYNKMMNIGPDAGACLHPSIHRHQLMAQELVRSYKICRKNKYPPAKPGVFQMRAKPYDTGSASRRITV